PPRVEQPRVEQPRVEKHRVELPPRDHEQHAQSNERQIRRVEEKASSIRTTNPQARDETLEQLLAQVRDLQTRVEGGKVGGSRGHLISQHILDADLPQGFRDLNISYDGSTDLSRHMRMPSTSEEIKAGGLTRGLLPGLCRNSLAKRPGRTFDEVLGRCAKYMNVKEAEADFLQMVKASKDDSRDEMREKKSSSTGERKGSPRAERDGRSRFWRPTQYTPLSAPQARILEVMEREIHDNIVRWPKTRKDGPTRPKSNLYCRFHKDYGHNTDDCRHLKDGIERLIKAGHLKEFIYKDREKSSRKRERSRSPCKRARTPENEELPQKKGVIHMIFGGSTDGDSNRARKAYARGRHGKVKVQQFDKNGLVMNFGPADVGEVERPHNDALMIMAQVSGSEVQRVFVDTGSSVNVIFYDCLKRMELDIQLTLFHTSLFGFNGSEVAPLGETMLDVVLGEGDLRKVKMVRFVVVDVESAYNVILGRPALNAFQAVVSTYHMKLKFPVGDR
ncbi:Unknown protein, partial [Striga hermonthica]